MTCILQRMEDRFHQLCNYNVDIPLSVAQLRKRRVAMREELFEVLLVPEVHLWDVFSSALFWSQSFFPSHAHIHSLLLLHLSPAHESHSHTNQGVIWFQRVARGHLVTPIRGAIKPLTFWLFADPIYLLNHSPQGTVSLFPFMDKVTWSTVPELVGSSWNQIESSVQKNPVGVEWLLLIKSHAHIHI